MSQVTSGPRSFLAVPIVYNAFQALVGGQRSRKIFAREFLRVSPHSRMLDIGCGPSEILTVLPESIEYVGFDLSAEYVALARKRFAGRGTWYCAPVLSMNVRSFQPFDLVAAIGLLHHLDDDEVDSLGKTVSAIVGRSGRFVTIDGCYVEGQSRVGRWIISRDRGRNVRSPEAYAELLQPYFSDVTTTVRHDLMRIPYTHAIITASSPRLGALAPEDGQ